VGKTIPDDQGTVVEPEPDTVAGQDQRRSDRVKPGSASWGLGRLGLPVGAAFGPGEVIGRDGHIADNARIYHD
jgi:hypothetical protein